MKKSLKRVRIIVPLVMVAVIALGGMYWGWKYYFLSNFPSRSAYEAVESRVDDALAFAHQNMMNEHYAFFVDYSIPSGKPRLYVWDFEKKKIVYCAYVMHGPGGGSTDKEAHFSDVPGSYCSSLGRFTVTKKHGKTVRPSFRLEGMDTDNQKSYYRGLMIHKSKWVDYWCWMKYIPLNEEACQGCVTVSRRDMTYLYNLIKGESDNGLLLLWSFVGGENGKK